MIILLLSIGVISAIMIQVARSVSAATVIRDKLAIRKRDTKQYIYFIQHRGMFPPYVKIGKTDNYIERLRNHSTTSPKGLHVLGIVVVQNCLGAERFLHHFFQENRIGRGEWFVPDLTMLLVIYYIRNEKHTRKANFYVRPKPQGFRGKRKSIQPQY